MTIFFLTSERIRSMPATAPAAGAGRRSGHPARLRIRETRQHRYRAMGCRIGAEAVPCASPLSIPRTTGTYATLTMLAKSVRAFLPRLLPQAEPPLARLAELTGQKKNRVYSYQAHVELPSR
jgi:hypothetical protein